MTSNADNIQLLILSGAYCAEELISEFGKIPPAFLPVGGKRLYELQREAFPFGSAWITLPSTFNINKIELENLKKLDINVIYVDENETLGNAFVKCCSKLKDYPTHILFGDTLVFFDNSVDFIGSILGVGKSDEDYSWHRLRPEINGEFNEVLIGYFYTDNLKKFCNDIVESNFNFIEGLYGHNKIKPWRILRDIKWLDFGHIHTYFQSKSSISTARSFNQVVTSKRITQKFSEDRVKIDAEAAWFENLPGILRPYTASFAGRIENQHKLGYCTEFLHLNTLSDLFVFSNLKTNVWSNIFSSCLEFLDLAAKFSSNASNDSRSLYLDKTLHRLDLFALESSFDIDAPCFLNDRQLPSLKEIAFLSAQKIGMLPEHPGVVHGDLCFSNVFYDFRARSIKIIDPRGIDANGMKSLYGDQRYDVAKLHHSVIGGYDFIIAGRYEIDGKGNVFKFSIPFGDRIAVQEYFLTLCFRGINFGGDDIHAISILLFLSMLPLHTDRPDRQRAFIANALRLFSNKNEFS